MEIDNLRKAIEDEKRRAKEEVERILESQKQKISDEERKTEERRRYIDHMADLVMAGRFGNGEARRIALGAEYNEIQNRVNERLRLPKRYPV